MAEFLAWIVQMLPSVVMQRFDKRSTGRYRMLSDKGIVRQPDEIAGTIGQPLRNQMDDLFRTALNMTFDHHKPRAHHLSAKPLHDFRPHHNVGNAGFVFQSHEHDAAGAPWALSHLHHTV